MSRRLEKISDLIMRELGRVIQNEISDPRIGFVTLSRVKVSTDLTHADVYVSVLGGDQDEANSLAGLKSSAAFLRNHLARTLTTRTVPKLNFVIDKGLDQSSRIQQILTDIQDDLQ